MSQGIIDRLVTATKTIITLGDSLKRLERQDARDQLKHIELARIVSSLSKRVAELSGQLKTIEKRLSDKDAAVDKRFADREKLMTASTRLQVREEIDKALAKGVGSDGVLRKQRGAGRKSSSSDSAK